MGPEEAKSDVARSEEEVLAFWEREGIFKQSEEQAAPQGEFTFYDGPPFATGLPHYGHILASTIKDAIPRYRTMRGFQVRRRWGWDCHGLPLENQIEKELGIETKRDIETLGVGKFNAAARNAVLRYADEWKKQIPRFGRWVDMENDYKTMDTIYTESVWWAFNELWNNGLIYEGFKSMHLCPRCGTTLSNFEVSLGYKDIIDFAVTVKLELSDEPDTYLLVWTTTPWTLPGNMAAAVNADEAYAKVRVMEAGKAAHYILGAAKVSELFKDQSHEIVGSFKGAELLGKSYVPPFDYFKNKELKGKENAWKIYHASYVSMADGTGAVHLAPVYGGEDMELAQKEGVPLYHHVTTDGVFTDDIHDLKGMPVKPKGDHQSADIEIIKKLAHRGVLFKKEKITHSYPLCWRCDTPLLVYAASSWFVRVTSLREQLVEENKNIRWVPQEIGEKRFGNWLEGARDWAISRSRYWGAPLPVWRNTETGDCTVIGSIAELKDKVKRSGNRYFIMRHGEAELTASQQISSTADAHNALTERGKHVVQEAVRGTLGGANIGYIVTSPLPRTFQTALLAAQELGIPQDNVLVDPRLTEISFGSFEGKTIPEYHAFYKNEQERFTKAPENGETWNEVKCRVTNLLYELEGQYTDTGVLIVSHNGPLQMIQAGAEGLDEKNSAQALRDSRLTMEPGEIRKLDFVPLPHNENYVLDLHRPSIDAVQLQTRAGVPLARIPDVFDCWFESGSMPYGQKHYPFENTDTFEPSPSLLFSARGYPADFISEGLDQTRGWFYSLLVLGVALFGRAPYKNVIVSGLVLAEDGQKMSKRLKNYPDPLEVVNRYGTDALRYYLLSSPLMRGEDLNFSEKGVAEVARKLIGRLRNVHTFLELYGAVEESSGVQSASGNVLDAWMLARLDETGFQITEAMERYELDAAARPLMKLVDDLSTWYLRRSRERLKGEDEQDRIAAYGTLRHVLKETAKLMAPFMPFYSEDLYRRVRGSADPSSVHLTSWTTFTSPTSEAADILAAMEEVRRLVTLALESRQKSGIRVRQPLGMLKVKSALSLSPHLLELIAEEVNVKEIHLDNELPESIFLDTTLTQELKEEGVVRDVIRAVQNLRKEGGMMPTDKIILSIFAEGGGKEITEKYLEQIARETTSSIHFQDSIGSGTLLEIEDVRFVLAVRSLPR